MIMCTCSAILVENPLKNCFLGQHLLQNGGAQPSRQRNDQFLLTPFERSKPLREDINTKKTFSFRHCTNHLIPQPPPPRPQFGQLCPFFSEVKIQDLKGSLELKILYILYDILYICNLKDSLKFNTLAF